MTDAKKIHSDIEKKKKREFEAVIGPFANIEFRRRYYEAKRDPIDKEETIQPIIIAAKPLTEWKHARVEEITRPYPRIIWERDVSCVILISPNPYAFDIETVDARGMERYVQVFPTDKDAKADALPHDETEVDTDRIYFKGKPTFQTLDQFGAYLDKIVRKHHSDRKEMKDYKLTLIEEKMADKVIEYSENFDWILHGTIEHISPENTENSLSKPDESSQVLGPDDYENEWSLWYKISTQIFRAAVNGQLGGKCLDSSSLGPQWIRCIAIDFREGLEQCAAIARK